MSSSFSCGVFPQGLLEWPSTPSRPPLFLHLPCFPPWLSTVPECMNCSVQLPACPLIPTALCLSLLLPWFLAQVHSHTRRCFDGGKYLYTTLLHKCLHSVNHPLNVFVKPDEMLKYMVWAFYSVSSETIFLHFPTGLQLHLLSQYNCIKISSKQLWSAAPWFYHVAAFS